MKVENTEAIFKFLVSAVQDYAIFALDPQGNILTWNIGAERLKGYTAQEAIGSHFSRFYTPEDLARNHPAKELEQAIIYGKYEEEGWRVRKDGSRFWAHVVITALKDTEGQLKGFAKVTRDLTDRIKAEQMRATELAYQETKALLNASPSFFGFVDPQTGVLTISNDLSLKVIGKTREEVFGKLFWECPWWKPLPESAARIREAIEKAAEGESSEFDVTYWSSPEGTPKGQARWVTFRAIPYRDKAGKINQIAVSGIDFTERKAAEEQTKEAIRIRDEFLSIASHELKTPLTGIKIHTQLLKRMLTKDPVKTLTNERISQFVGIVELGMDRLSRLVEDMLDISRIENRKLSFHFEKIDLSELVSETLKRFRLELADAGIEVITDLEAGLLAKVDRFRFEQVLTNLITNAIRYAPRKPVEVTLSHANKRAVLSFRDSGPGIDKKDQEKIFKRFERLISANEVSGMGLGLFICKQIILGHRGSIRVESELGQGARFIIELPLAEKEP